MKKIMEIMKIGMVMTLSIFLMACGTQKQENVDSEGIKILTLANFGNNREIEKQVQIFNQNHSDYRIEIVKYERSTQPEDDGIAKLQREIASGNGPDIINFGGQYATTDIVGKYTEDLLPYLGGELEGKYFSNILKAFTYQEGLYAIPISFTLQTFAGSSDILEQYENWTIQEMMSCYMEQAEGVVLYPGETKKDVFCTILTGNMESFIDWENKTCTFGDTAFKDMLNFANSFPDTLIIDEDYSVKQIFNEGKALLLPLQMENIYDICKGDLIFGEATKYVGFPVEEGSGTVIKPSETMLAISSCSENKEIAWEFICQFLDEQYQCQREKGIPIIKSAYEVLLANGQKIEYKKDEQGKEVSVSKAQVIFEGEDPIDIYNISATQAEQLTNLIEKAEICATNDYQLYNILLEEAQSFFEEGKDLEAVADIIQSRASIYVKEK